MSRTNTFDRMHDQLLGRQLPRHFPVDLNVDPRRIRACKPRTVIHRDCRAVFRLGAYSVAFRLLQNAADAEDAVQEAYISAFKTLHLAIPHRRQRLLRIPKDKSRAKYISENLFDDALVYDWEYDLKGPLSTTNSVPHSNPDWTYCPPTSAPPSY